MSGRQSVVDRMQAARHTISGSDLAKSVCKATTEEIMGPKKKHLDYQLQCTSAEHINIPDLADQLAHRATNGNWVVVFKTLVTTHHLMIYGHERFMWCLATRASVFSLDDFTDKTNVQGYDMSTYIRRYAKYINCKALAFRQMAFDFCRAKRGKEEGVLRTMGTEKLLKTLPALQDLMDSLLDFEVTSNNLSNGVINSAFMLLFKDSIRLFACYNDGIINLLEKYFDMNKKDCKFALDIYKKFLIRMERIGEFLKVAEQVGIDKGEIPDLAKAPSSLLEALEQHLASIESSKKSTWNKASTVQSAVNAFSSSMANVDSQEKRKALEEEKARLQALKEQRLRESQETITMSQAPAVHSTPPAAFTPSPQAAPVPAPVAAAPVMAANNPFAPAQAAVPAPVVPAPAPISASTSGDLFSTPTVNNNQPPAKLSQDLIGLSANPMNSIIQAQMATQVMNAPPPQAWGSPNGFANNNDIGANFDKAFGGGLPPTGHPVGPPAAQPNALGLGDLLQPMNRSAMPPTQAEMMAAANGNTQLDSTLSKLATNLEIRGASSPKKTEHQWTKNQPSQRTGGAGWSPQKVAMGASAPGWGGAAPPMGGYMTGQSADWRGQAFSGQFGGGQQMMGQQPMMGGIAPRPMGVAPVGAYGQPMGVAQPVYGQPQRAPAPAQAPADPFGNL